jgi:hypothetical protein
MLESPLARGTGIAALADVTVPSARATTAGIFKLNIFMGSPPIMAHAMGNKQRQLGWRSSYLRGSLTSSRSGAAESARIKRQEGGH